MKSGEVAALPEMGAVKRKERMFRERPSDYDGVFGEPW